MSSPIQALLQQAVAKHQQGYLQQAEDLYVQVLQIDAQQFDALHLIGLIAKQRGDTQSAMNFFAKAIAINPRDAKVHCNLGATFQEIGNAQQALVCYDLALTLKKDYALAWNNRGNSLRSLHRYQEALDSFTKAMEIQLNYPEAFLNRGICLQELEEHEQALADFEDALSLRSDYAEAVFARAFSLQQLRLYEQAHTAYSHALNTALAAKTNHSSTEKLAAIFCNRGMVCAKLQRFDEALSDFQQAIALRADFMNAYIQAAHIHQRLQQNEAAIRCFQTSLKLALDTGREDIHQKTIKQEIAYHLAALGAAPTPLAAPTSYVKDLFDQYADHFDAHLQENLAYQVPQLLQSALHECGLSQLGRLAHAIDLGCGTGLCGTFLASIVEHLTGVDLSEKMLAKARVRAVYDELVCDDILQYLEQYSSKSHLIVAADVLVYLGDLDRLFSLVKNCLQQNGYFAFSVEESDSDEFCLQYSQRYAHSSVYLTRLAHAHGFQLRHCSQHQGRRDAHQAVASLIVVLQRI
jgi:predicted TPR repeat methyltransferase